MKHNQFIIFIILTVLSSSAFSQRFDLIVNEKGDSTACFIDSVGIEKLYYKKMKNYEWVSDSIEKTSLREYKRDAFKNISIVFIQGTSEIQKVIPDKKITSVKDLQKNAIYVELEGTGGVMTLNYERLFPMNNKFGITARAGIGYPVLTGELNILTGGPRNYLETGAGIATDFITVFESIRLGYRFTAYNGLVVRAAPILYYNRNNDENTIWSLGYGISLGYSF